MKLLRLFVIILICLVTLVVAGIFIFLKAFNPDHYLPQITQQASRALGHKVRIGHVGLALSHQGLTLDVGPLQIADAPQFAQSNLASIQHVHVAIDFWALIAHRQIHVTHILVESPQIHIIRSRQGLINVQSMASNSSAGVDQPAAAGQPTKSTADAPSLLALSIQSVELRDLLVTFSDEETGLALQLQVPSVVISLPQLQASASSIAGLQAQVVFSGATLKSPALLKPVTAISAKIIADARDIHLSALSIRLASGTMEGTADIKGYLSTQDFDLELSVAGLKLEEIADQKDWPFQLKGQLSGQCKFTGKGFDPQGLLKNLKGSGEMDLANGVLEHFNIAKLALSSTVGAVPGLGDILENLLSGALQGQLGGENTDIDKARVKFSVHDAAVLIDSALMQTKAFDLTAQGSMNDQLDVNLQTVLHLSSELSASIVAKIKEFGYLMDGNKRVVIGAKVTGPLLHLKYKPNADVKKTAQSALIDQGTQQLQKVIQKNPQVGQILNSIFGSSSSSSESSSPAGSSSTSQPGNGDSTQKTINNLLQNILK